MPSPKRTPPSFISDTTSSGRSRSSTAPSMATPVATLGKGSRTRKATAASVGPGSGSGRRRSPLMERAHPVAPVPVVTMTPEEDWRSSRPAWAIR